MKKILSIIIPVYNVEKYLAECIESVIKSARMDYEIVLINDGSTDKSNEICERYVGEYTNIKLITQENRGLSGARNTGIQNATGEYLLFLDSDDYLADGAVEEICSNIETRNTECFMIRSKSFEDGSEIFSANQCNYKKFSNVTCPVEVFEKLNSVRHFWFAAWLLVVKKDFLVENNLYFREGIYHEDELWVPKVFASMNSITLVNSCLYCYRLNRTGSIITKKNIKKAFDIISIMDELSASAKQLPIAKRNMLNRRVAVLEWALIRNFSDYISDIKSKILYREIVCRIEKLKVGKYKVLYLICKLFGILRVSKLVSKIVKS